MKEIFYSETEKFLLTDSEFEDALKFFSGKTNYYCKRLKMLFTPFFKFVKPYESNEYYFKFKDGKFKQVYKMDGSYFVDEGGALNLIRFKNNKQKIDFEKRLIGADEYLK